MKLERMAQIKVVTDSIKRLENTMIDLISIRQEHNIELTRVIASYTDERENLLKETNSKIEVTEKEYERAVIKLKELNEGESK